MEHGGIAFTNAHLASFHPQVEKSPSNIYKINIGVLRQLYLRVSLSSKLIVPTILGHIVSYIISDVRL